MPIALTPDVVPANTPLTFADWLSGVLTRWRTIAWAIAATFLAGFLAVLIIKPKYEAEASFVINGAGGAKGGLSSASAGLGALAGQLGLGTGGDPSESPAFYVQLLESRELLTRLLTSKFHDPRSASPQDSVQLIQLINVRSSNPRRRMELAVKKLRRNLEPESNVKTALVRLWATTQWPTLSADVANRAMQLVNIFDLQQRASRARSRRMYLEERVIEARTALRDAETHRREFLMGNRRIDLSPSLQFDDEQLKRDIDIARDEFTSVQKQYEGARLDELSDAALITVVDSAIPPAKAKWPQYPWLIVGCILVGLIIGVSIAGSAVVWHAWAERNPRSAARLSRAWTTTTHDLMRRRAAKVTASA